MPRGDFQGNVGFSQELIFTEMFSKMFLRCNFVRSLFPVLKEGWLWSGVDFQRNVSEFFFFTLSGVNFQGNV